MKPNGHPESPKATWADGLEEIYRAGDVHAFIDDEHNLPWCAMYTADEALAKEHDFVRRTFTDDDGLVFSEWDPEAEQWVDIDETHFMWSGQYWCSPEAWDVTKFLERRKSA